MANGPGKVLADGETQVQRYLEADGFSRDEIEEASSSCRTTPEASSWALGQTRSTSNTVTTG